MNDQSVMLHHTNIGHEAQTTSTTQIHKYIDTKLFIQLLFDIIRIQDSYTPIKSHFL
jgi:hypothetical protein